MTIRNILQREIGKKLLRVTVIKMPYVIGIQKIKISSLFYVHTPFCEQLCNFCLCSKEITKDYSKVKNYLYDYLSKEMDMLEDHLSKNNINFNYKEIYLGGDSPTYYKKDEFKYLVKD